MILAVDASAIVAIYLDEPEAEAFKARIASATVSLMSPVNYWEVTTTVRGRSGEAAVGAVERLMTDLGIVVEPISLEQGRAAVTAAGRFGRGFHPAKLNMGDCFAYALSKATGAPLLFKGNDFPQTDISAAL